MAPNSYILFILNQNLSPYLIPYLEVMVNLYILTVSQMHLNCWFQVFCCLTNTLYHVFIWWFDYRQNHNIVNLFSCQLIWIFSLGHINVQKSFLSRLKAYSIYSLFMFAKAPQFWYMNFVSSSNCFNFFAVKDVCPSLSLRYE